MNQQWDFGRRRLPENIAGGWIKIASRKLRGWIIRSRNSARRELPPTKCRNCGLFCKGKAPIPSISWELHVRRAGAISSEESSFPILKNLHFRLKNLHFLIKNLHFYIKSGCREPLDSESMHRLTGAISVEESWFPILKNLDFLFKNLHFLIKNLGYIIKAKQAEKQVQNFDAVRTAGSELQDKCQISPDFSIEKAEMIENCPWKRMLCIEKWPIIVAIRGNFARAAALRSTAAVRS